MDVKFNSDKIVLEFSISKKYNNFKNYSIVCLKIASLFYKRKMFVVNAYCFGYQEKNQDETKGGDKNTQ